MKKLLYSVLLLKHCAKRSLIAQKDFTDPDLEIFDFKRVKKDCNKYVWQGVIEKSSKVLVVLEDE